MVFERRRKDTNYEVEKSKKIVSAAKKSQICLWIDAKAYKRVKQLALDKELSISRLIELSIYRFIEEEGDK